MKISLLISAEAEWQAVRTLYPDVPVVPSPFGDTMRLKIESWNLDLYFHSGWGKISSAAVMQYVIDLIALAYDTLPERYNPSIFNQLYESFPEGFLVATHNRTLIGFLIGIKTTPNTARILMLCVDEKNRKQGIGSALLKQFLLFMKNLQIRCIELEVRTANKGALGFYIKQGFIIQEKLRQFYQSGEDAYSMKKEL